MTHLSHSYFIVAMLVGLIVLAVAASISDFKFRRIPNQYLIWAIYFWASIYICIALLFPFKMFLMGFLISLLGMLMGGLFLYPSYHIKQVGAGDVKLAMVFGLFLGFKGAMLSVLMGAMVGGVWALALAWKYGGLKHMWYNIKFMARSVYLSGFKDMGWDLKSEGAITMPYGIALSIGASMIAAEQIFIHVQKIMALG